MLKTIMLTSTMLGLSCTSTLHAMEGEFFFTASIEHQIDRWSDQLIRTGCHTKGETRFCTGSNPMAELKIGYEFGFGPFRQSWYLPVVQAGYKHRSHWLSGVPFNDDPETHSESLYVELKIGGIR